MSQLDLNGFKKRKRGEKVFKFKVFGSRGYPSGFNGSFQENMKALLEFGHVERGVCGAMASWSFQLEASRQPLLHLVLFVVEEPIELSLEFSCKHCRYIGWGNHMICNKSYHFVLPSKGFSNEYGETNLIELKRESHSLHGVFHSNGFGHLLCINGSENGSGLVGYQIMEFWDRLCKGLGAREVSLRDSSKKKGMDLRLLHSVAYGRPWFGQWDYFVKHGSYGINQETYQDAIKTIQNTPLSLIANQLGYGSCQNEIFLTYQALSSHPLITLSDLFHFMLGLKSRIPKESSSSSYPTIMSDASCRWSPKRVEKAIHVVVEALKRAEFQWVSRQQVREVARAYIGDTGLLDFVLKSLGNHMVGKYLVRRCLNPVTKVLEYCLEDVSRTFQKEGVWSFVEGKLRPQHKVCWGQLVKDFLFLYDNILGDRSSKNGVFGEIFMASRIILDSKHLVKDYHGEMTINENTHKRRIYCKALLEKDSSSSSSSSTTPYHCFFLKSNATFNELRCEVEKAFKETYFSLRNMVGVSITNMSPLGSDPVFKTVRPGSKIAFLCTGIENEVCSELTVVYCVCGARDDDGERMVSCDLCRVWQHTRCVMIPDHKAVPDIFLCSGCEQDIVRFRCYASSALI